MIDKLLTKFNKEIPKDNSDLGEKIGNMGLGLLRIGFGETIAVEKISGGVNFSKEIYSTSARVAAIALFIIALPVTSLLAGVGCIGMMCSKSHEQTFNLFNFYRQYNSPTNRLALAFPTQKQVRFGKAECRLFNKEDPANKMGKMQSVELKEKEIAISQERRIPPLSWCDTVVMSKTGIIESEHGSGELFSDNEIVEKLEIVKRTELGSNIYASYTKHGKAIIQQQATRGCTAATAAMLIMDNQGKPDLDELRNRNLGTDEDQVRDIQKAGLRAAINPASNLSELRALIIKNGSAIVDVSEKLGSHVIVVDEVSRDLSKIRLRDPCHGWEITVGQEAFLKEWDPLCPGTVIQVMPVFCGIQVRAVCLAVQAVALGVLMLCTENPFTPVANQFLPGNCNNVVGSYSLAFKNIALVAASVFSVINIFKEARPILTKLQVL